MQIDQPLFFAGGCYIVPTDGNGITLVRTPQQVGGWVGGSARGNCQVGGPVPFEWTSALATCRHYTVHAWSTAPAAESRFIP